MNRPTAFQLLAAGVALACAACAPHPQESSNDAAAPAQQPAAAEKVLSACELVTAAEMSALLGGGVTAEPGPTNGQTSCTYNPVKGISPYAELKVEWGSGEGGMMGAGFANAHEPGLADQLDGLGDQAVSMGPAIMIRRDEDLVTIVLSGVDDVTPHIRAIYALVDKRMK